jgi:rhamnose utilization protein RhaD (predicted bifunctional aldolase and dehydrogenase)
MDLENKETNVSENLEQVKTEGEGQKSNDINEDISLIKAELDRLRATNSRLLEESKKYKQQKRETDLKLLDAEGKKDEIIKTLQEELEEKRNFISQHEQEKINDFIVSEIAKKAEKYGCEDWDHLIHLGNTDLIEFDEETNTVKGIDLFFEQAMNNERFKKFFTKIEKVKTNNSLPSMSQSNWKDDPLPYLRQLKKEGKISEYNKAVQELEKSGLLR